MCEYALQACRLVDFSFHGFRQFQWPAHYLQSVDTGGADCPSILPKLPTNSRPSAWVTPKTVTPWDT